MEEKLNIAEKLKDVPKGTKLWSPICGECILNKVTTDSAFPIECKTKNYKGVYIPIIFTADGECNDNYEDRECVLFPSRDNHDWSTFKVPKKHKFFEPFQKVLCASDLDNGHEVWAADFYSHYDESTFEHYLASGVIVSDNEILPYEGNEVKLGKTVK